MHRGKKTKELLAIVSLSVFVFFGLIGTSTATVIYEDVGFLVAPEGGPEFVFDINSFTITDAGAYKATLTDFGCVIGDPGGGLEHRPFRGAGSHDP
jgi:hypothetical protein